VNHQSSTGGVVNFLFSDPPLEGRKGGIMTGEEYVKANWKKIPYWIRTDAAGVKAIQDAYLAGRQGMKDEVLDEMEKMYVNIEGYKTYPDIAIINTIKALE
jgi:hypothetical protein